VRAAFLEVTKQFHPSRFARRDRDIVRQANEVFLRLKAAYDQLRSEEGLGRARQRHSEGSGQVRARAATVPASPRARTEADGDAQVAREVEPDDAPPGPTGKGKARAARGTAPPDQRHPRAISVVEQVLERNQRDSALFDEASDLCEQGRWGEARRLYHQLAVDNSHVKRYRVHMHYAWGREHQQAGRLEEARAEYRRVLDLDPEFAAAERAVAGLPEPKDKPRGLFSRLFRK
jgi:tetratricopeptide (TPR) repeat protein